MYRSEARAIVGVSPIYTRADVDAAFRSRVRVVHPDGGGHSEAFHELVEARQLLLLGLSLRAAVVVDPPSRIRRVVAHLAHRSTSPSRVV